MAKINELEVSIRNAINSFATTPGATEVVVVPGYLLDISSSISRPYGHVTYWFSIRPTNGKTCLSNKTTKAGIKEGARLFAAMLDTQP